MEASAAVTRRSSRDKCMNFNKYKLQSITDRKAFHWLITVSPTGRVVTLFNELKEQ